MFFPLRPLRLCARSSDFFFCVFCALCGRNQDVSLVFTAGSSNCPSRRGISATWVEAALTSPDQVMEGHGGRLVAQRRRRVRHCDKLLRVVFEETEDKYVVITAYLTSDINDTGRIKPHEGRIRCSA
ncbi:MAG: DUF4258 domain-containing protein [Candidatus Binatia bacterium]